MLTIRNSTFETNSSSTHSMVIATEDEFNKWKSGEMLYKTWAWSTDKLKEGLHLKEVCIEELLKDGSITEKELLEADEDELLEMLQEGDFYTYDNWREDLEHETAEYTTPGGEKLIIECAYGYDG